MKYFSLLSEAEDPAQGGQQNQGDRPVETIDNRSNANGGSNNKLKLETDLSGKNIKLIRQKGYLTNKTNELVNLHLKFNDKFEHDPETKDYFESIHLKDPDPSIAEKFNRLQETVAKAEVYSKSKLTTATSKVGIVPNAVLNKDKKDTEFKASASATTDEKKAKEEENYNRLNSHADEQIKLTNQFAWARDNNIQILQQGMALIRNLMDNMNKLTKLSITSANFHRNYNNNLKIFENSLNMANAVKNKTKITEQIKKSIEGKETVSKLDKTGSIKPKTVASGLKKPLEA